MNELKEDVLSELKENIMMVINRTDLKDKQKIALIKYFVQEAK